PPPPTCTPYPYTTLFRSRSPPSGKRRAAPLRPPHPQARCPWPRNLQRPTWPHWFERLSTRPRRGPCPSSNGPSPPLTRPRRGCPDRKSTRLNSSHQIISY